MKVIKATIPMLESRILVIGFQAENQRTQVRIDCAPIFAEYPHATPSLAIKPPVGETYPVFVNRDGTEVVWDIVANNLALKGDGELQLTFYKDNVIAKTSIGHITVNRSLQIDGEMPDVVATWIENANRKLAEVDAQIVELEEMVDTATDAATRAEQSASTASTKAEQAAGSAATATEKATEATNAAGTAIAKASEAEQSAQTATEKATAAAESERIATAKAGEATTAAGTATTKAEQATEAAQTATEKAGDASASATAAHASEINAAESADDALSAEVGANAAKRAAETSATQAGISAQNAGTAAQTATQKATEASQSATNAATFAGTATTKAEEAAASAQAASDAQAAVEEFAVELAESLEQIDQNTQDIAEHEQYAEATYAKKTDLSNLTSDLDLVQASGNIVETDDAFPTFAEDVTVEIVPVQSGSGDPSPDNVRPITGFDGVKVSRARKNLLSDQTIYNSGSTYFVGGQSGNVYPFYLKAGTYTFSYDGLGSYSYWQLKGTSTNNVISNGANKYGTFTLPVDGYYRFWFYQPSASSVDDFYNIQLELGDTATSYEPYQGIQVELPFGQTVYGGTIDLTTGKLTVDRVSKLLNDPTKWATTPSNTVNFICYEDCSDRRKTAESFSGLLCSYMIVNSASPANTARWVGATSNNFGIKSETLTIEQIKADAADGKIAISYPLATPQVYNLTPAQVLLLRDYNVLWANTGDIINLEYRAGAFVTKKTYDALKEATLIHSTASGTIASFSDGAEMPVDEVTAQINPVQDLHGYDHPWPGGGEKNFLGLLSNIDTTVNGVRLTFNAESGEFVVSGTNTNTASHLIYRWYKSGNALSVPEFTPGETYTLFSDMSQGGMYAQFTYNSTSEVVSPMGYLNIQNGRTVFTVRDSFASLREFQLYVSGSTTTLDTTFHIWLEKGSVASSSYTPYSNICPITGWDAVKVTRTGKNIINPSDLVYSAGGNNVWYGTQLPPDTDFVFSTDSTITGLYVAYSDADEMPSISGVGWANITYKYNTTSLGFNSGSHKWYRLMTYEINGVIRDRLYQLELGSTATDYEPYAGQTYDIAFPSEAGTVYGGSLSIAEDGSGQLAVNRVAIVFDGSPDEDWGLQNEVFVVSAPNTIATNSTESASMQIVSCDRFKSNGVRYRGNCGDGNIIKTVGTNRQIACYSSAFAGIDEFKASLTNSPMTVVYGLATPITYTLTASEIRTLLGQNNIWADTGDVAVKYNADTKLYVDGKIAELVAQIVNS